MRKLWSQERHFSLDKYEGALKGQQLWLVTDFKSLHDASHNEGAAPS